MAQTAAQKKALAAAEALLAKKKTQLAELQAQEAADKKAASEARAKAVTAQRLATSPIAKEAARTTAALKSFTAKGGLLGVPSQNREDVIDTIDNGDGTKTITYSTGRKETVASGVPVKNTSDIVDTELKTDAQIAAEEAAGEKKAARQSAYDLLYTQFKLYGLEALVEPLKNLITSGVSPSQFTIELRASKPYQERFAANAKRIANGFAAIDEATYLDLEDRYQSIMQNYGLPPSYYEKGTLGVQKGFEDLIGGNVDPVTLEERVIEGQKLLKGVKQTTDAAKQFYPELNDGDFLAYVLNPKNALSDIKRKVTAAEIGGAQLGAGLAATAAGAEQLAAAGVTGQRYQQAAPTIAETATRGSQLASMYGESPYTQTTAEQAILNVPGSAEAVKQTKKLTALEQAEFAKKSGVGILSRERAGAI